MRCRITMIALLLLATAGCARGPMWVRVAEKYVKADAQAIEGDYAAILVGTIVQPDTLTEEVALKADDAYTKAGAAITLVKVAIRSEDIVGTRQGFKIIADSAKMLNAIKSKMAAPLAPVVPK